MVLSEAGKKRFIRAYETRIEQWYTHPIQGVQFPLRQCVVEQARQIATDIAAQGGPADLSDKEVVALIAYMQRLGTDIRGAALAGAAPAPGGP